MNYENIIEALNQIFVVDKKIDEIKKKRSQYMQKLYQITEGDENKIVYLKDIGEQLRFDDSTSYQIAQYLKEEGLLDFVTLGGGIKITHLGVVKMETELSGPSKPEEHLQPQNIIKIENSNINLGKNSNIFSDNTIASNNTTNSQNIIQKKGKYAKGKLTVAILSLIVAVVIGTVLIYLTLNEETVLVSEPDISQGVDTTNRPLIAGNKVRITDNSLLFDIQNFGEIPNESGQRKILVVMTNSSEGLTREILSQRSGSVNPLMVIIPSQKISIILEEEILEGIDKAIQSDLDLFLGIVLQYGYGENKTGEYGYIGKYNPNYQYFDIIESWTE